MQGKISNVNKRTQNAGQRRGQTQVARVKDEAKARRKLTNYKVKDRNLTLYALRSHPPIFILYANAEPLEDPWDLRG